MFSALKEILHATAAKEIKSKINDCKMELATSTTPDYIKWIQQISKLAESSKNTRIYDIDSCNEGELVEIFIQQYNYAYDNKLNTST
jgi:hypothetical protein